jgi:organic hydroperoxide reductase OsmC/OhrA
MTKYPVSFFAKAQAHYGIQSQWTVESLQLKTYCAIPREFEGPGAALSPEDLFAQSLVGCFIATFKVFAEKSKVDFKDIMAEAELIVDLNEERKPIMKTCTLHVHIIRSTRPDRVKTLADKAFSSGFILNSVKTEMKLSLTVTE